LKVFINFFTIFDTLVSEAAKIVIQVERVKLTIVATITSTTLLILLTQFGRNKLKRTKQIKTNNLKRRRSGREHGRRRKGRLRLGCPLGLAWQGGHLGAGHNSRKIVHVLFILQRVHDCHISPTRPSPTRRTILTLATDGGNPSTSTIPIPSPF
jgi:hypothetical protein